VRGDEVRIWTGAGTDTNATSAGELYVEGDLEVDGTVYMGSCSGAGCAGGTPGWTDGGTTVALVTLTDQVGIGTSAAGSGVKVDIKYTDATTNPTQIGLYSHATNSGAINTNGATVDALNASPTVSSALTSSSDLTFIGINSKPVFSGSTAGA